MSSHQQQQLQQQLQQQQTAEKSVQTQDTSGPTTLIVANKSSSHHPHIQHENTAAEVANTLVSMATGQQRGTNVKQLVRINYNVNLI